MDYFTSLAGGRSLNLSLCAAPDQFGPPTNDAQKQKYLSTGALAVVPEGERGLKYGFADPRLEACGTRGRVPGVSALGQTP